MKKLTMILLAAGAITLGGLAAFASARHHDPAKRIEHMKKALNLSDAQVAQIKTIYQNNEATFKADRDAVKAAADGNAKKAAFQKMRADMQAVQAQITPILTADQQAKMKDMMAKHEGHGQWGGHEKGEAPAQK